MVKCEVLTDCALAVKKGSIVYVEDRQYEIAKRYLKKKVESNKSEEKQKNK